MPPIGSSAAAASSSAKPAVKNNTGRLVGSEPGRMDTRRKKSPMTKNTAARIP